MGSITDLRNSDFFNNISLGKKQIRGRFCIPSGVRCSSAKSIERYFCVDSVGIITTKSTSILPKNGYAEPLYVKYAENSYMNAVGLENPGAEIFAKELSKIRVPENKFLLVSIFGEDVQSFYEAAKLLAPYADGFELNMSCPHAKGYGLQVGSDIDLVAAIINKLTQEFDIPIFAKISATVPNMAEIARAAVENGAYGITVTNSVGPGLFHLDGVPILSNVVGGLSGEAIRPLGIKTIMDIRQKIGGSVPIIGMGGIFTAKDIEDYYITGADFFGIGSALTGLSTEETARYFNALEYDLIHGTKYYMLPPVSNMDYQKCTVESNIALTNTLHKIRLSPWAEYEFMKMNTTAGKFFFLTIPQIGEKPFAVFDMNEREFIIKNVGQFTGKLTELNPGDTLYLRGPYGKELPEYDGYEINFIAGGTGISPCYEIAKHYAEKNKIRFFFGGKIAGDVFEADKYSEIGEVNAATEDGSIGAKGFVTDVLDSYVFDHAKPQIFINVGPKPMIEKAYEIERGIVQDENIWASIEYHTSCGVGICGKCSNENGYITCVDGPFLSAEDALKIKDCKHL